jgi:site-specific recombinase XerD
MLRLDRSSPILVHSINPSLEAGVNIRRIQQYLGHRSLSSTMVYRHLTTQGHQRAYVRPVMMICPIHFRELFNNT